VFYPRGEKGAHVPLSLFNNTAVIWQSNKASSTNVIFFGGAYLQGAVQTQVNSVTIGQTTGL
jgi:hypothetical protein